MQFVGLLRETPEPESLPRVGGEPEPAAQKRPEADGVALRVEKGDGETAAVLLQAADHDLLALRRADQAALEGLDGRDGAARLFSRERVEFDAAFGLVWVGHDGLQFEDDDGAFRGHVLAAHGCCADDDEGTLFACVLGDFEGHHFHACDGFEVGEFEGVDDVVRAGGEEVEGILRNLRSEGDVCGTQSAFRRNLEEHALWRECILCNKTQLQQRMQQAVMIKGRCRYGINYRRRSTEGSSREKRRICS